MILPDVNVLLYAFRADTPEHKAHRDWLAGVVNGDSAFAISTLALSGLVRISTHPRVFRQPSTLAEAFAFSQTLLDQPHCVSLSPGERHWEIFTKLTVEADATGNLVPDAYFAALAIEHGCEWITTDRDYARFPGLTWRTPF